jgi:hypothetical protein
MNNSWGTKASHRRKRAIVRTKFRWDLLGLTDPERTTSTQSIEDIRRQIISAASQGLSPDTLARSQTKDVPRKPGPKASRSTRTRRATS